MIPGINNARTAFQFLGMDAANAAEEVNTPLMPRLNPTFVREAQVGYGTVLALGADVNASTLFPRVQLQEISSLDQRLAQIAAETQAPKVINVQAPQDPVLALIEKVNFLSLSMGALKDNAVGSLVTGAAVAGINAAATAATRLKSAVSTIRVPKITLPSAGTLSGIASAATRAKTALSGWKSPSIKAPSAGGFLTFASGADRARISLNALARTSAAPKVTVPGGLATIKTQADAAKRALDSLDGTTAETKVTNTEHNITINETKTIKGARGGIFSPKRYEKMAAGGFANYAQFYDPFTIIGESGREAIVPLSRPLGQVDPSVRMLSAIAQGKVNVTAGGPSVEANGWTIVTPTEDPAAVATEALNQLTAMAY
jgi:hypothetical protein